MAASSCPGPSPCLTPRLQRTGGYWSGSMPQLYQPDTPLPADAAYRVVATNVRPALLLPGPRRRVGHGRAHHVGSARGKTTFAALWNDHGLAIRFDVCDERPWHTMTKRDRPDLGRRGRRDLPRPDAHGPRLSRSRDQPHQRRHRPADPASVAGPRQRHHVGLGGAREHRRSRDPAKACSPAAGWRWRGCPGPGLEHVSPEVAAASPPTVGRPLDVQRLPHQAAGRSRESQTRRDLRRLVGAGRPELPRAGVLQGLRLRRAGQVAGITVTFAV